MSALTEDQLQPQRVWRRLEDIPIGRSFVPDFDELVHPMRKVLYQRISEQAFENITDFCSVDMDEMRRWWGWISRFEEVK